MGFRWTNTEPLPEEPAWPDQPGPYLFLLELSGSAEEVAIRGWLERHKPDHVNEADFWIARLPQTRRRVNARRQDPRLDAFLATDADPLLVPMRVIWLPRERDGRRAVGITDLLTPGDPRDPDQLRQHLVLRTHPERVRIIMGAQGRAGEVREAWNDPEGRPRREGQGLAQYVAHRAWLTLERAERAVRGNRYKVPRFPRESLTERRSFTRGVAELARQSGQSYAQMARTTDRYVREIAATHTPYVIDLVAGTVRWLIGRSYVKIRYDREELQALYALSQQYPLVFLPGHKSNFDHLVLLYVLYSNGLPPNHTAGGDNMNFFPAGPFLRRSGVFFIRREFKDNAPYKFVLRQYIDYLLEKRFPMEWFIEGGRSRSGKLRPPRFGMLAYVVESFQRGSVDDVVFIPVSIAYDQIEEVGEYAAEMSGKGEKEAESFGWMARTIVGLRDRYGEVHIRFGAPISLSTFLADLGDPDLDTVPSQNPAIPKLAFEVATRINEVTPITPTALVALALLNNDHDHLTLDSVLAMIEPFRAMTRQREFPLTLQADESTEELGERITADLVAHDLVSLEETPDGDRFYLTQDQVGSAAYYRNTIVHFFVNRAITELALVAALGVESDKLDRVIIDEALELRDLLKFEFFFAPSDEFVEQIRAELRVTCPDWRALARAGDVAAILADFEPSMVRGVLEPFFQSYRLVADSLERAGEETVDRALVGEDALVHGEEQLRAGTLRTPESLSSVLFDSAIALASNRNLLHGGDSVASRRRDFAQQLRNIIKRTLYLTSDIYRQQAIDT